MLTDAFIFLCSSHDAEIHVGVAALFCAVHGGFRQQSFEGNCPGIT